MTTAFYTHPACKLHEMGADHPESPLRLSTIDDYLITSRIDDLVLHCEAPLATEDELALVHTRGTIARIKEHTPEFGYYPLDGDTLLNPSSWTAARAAAGAAIAATKAVLDGEVENAFCSIRPPGHHATPDEAMGFCLFNNLALAAKHALDVHGLERIAIVDFDVHHGNGTQAVFENDPRVLMVSFFQHPCYPYSGTEFISKNMLNLPVPAYTDGALIRSLVEQHWLPALHAHQPQMIFISAGFDAHREDLIGQLGLVEADYAWITMQIMQIAKQYSFSRVVSCLEGGYNTSALGRSVVAHIKVLAGLD
ncbi:histone deacetylase family protein [Solimicrobium silvestre]|uniref:Deacetylase n=1 Tax=Solimicrobium silvestre TaxID=2099400 RepID=A0A2S9GXU4_9BURK|nr:histone deacetylase family protein [Solimicrobium silvestre]PRC92544.1 Deacetylase [Solimicrobium silvestre]